MRTIACLLAAIALLGLGIRWGCMSLAIGRDFQPTPDATEYAALAHDLADRGDYALQVGEQRLRSRYPPGWPLLLSSAVHCGLRGEQLVYVAGIVSCLCALAMALVGWLVWDLLGPADPGRRQQGLIVAWIVGLGWIVTPVSLHSGTILMSDEASALFANLGLAVLAWALLRERSRTVALAAAGCALAAATAIRPVNAYLGAGPVLCLVLAAARRRGWRTAGRRLPSVALGALPVTALVATVLYRAGFEPFAWSRYELWDPELYESVFGSVFALSHALGGNPDAPSAAGLVGHGEIALRVFGGYLWPHSGYGHAGLGYLWPTLVWPLVAVVGIRAWRRQPERWVGACLGLALLGWLLGHVVLYSLYCFPDPRFHCAPAAWAWVLLALCVVTLRGSGGGRAVAALLLVGAFAGAITAALPQISLAPETPVPRNIHTSAQLERWLQQDPRRRRSGHLPFDTVRAQALGLLTPRLRAAAGDWGIVAPNQFQRHSMLVRGLLPAVVEAPPVARRLPGRPLRIPHAVELASHSVLFEAGAEVVFEAADLDGQRPEQFALSLAALQDGELRIRHSRSDTVFTAPVPPGSPCRLNRFWRVAYIGQGADAVTLRLQGRALEVIRPGRETAAFVDAGPGQDLAIAGFAGSVVRAGGRGEFRSVLESDAEPGRVTYLSVAATPDPCLPIIDREPSPFRAHAGTIGQRTGPSVPAARAGPGIGILTADTAIPEARVPTIHGPRPGRPTHVQGAAITTWITGPAQRLLHPRVASVLGEAIRAPADRDRIVAESLVAGRRPVVAAAAAEADRLAALLGGVLRAVAASTLRTVHYVDDAGRELALSAALAAGLDLSAPRWLARYACGLELRVNLGTRDWVVADDGGDLRLPRFGFLATGPVTALSARRPTGAGVFDYAATPGDGQLIDGRGQPVAYRGLSTTGGLVRTPAPAITGALRIVGGGDLRPGRQSRRLRLVAAGDAGPVDLTHLATWTSDAPATVNVDSLGVATAHGLGTVTLTARLGGRSAALALRATADLDIDPLQVVHRSRTHLDLLIEHPQGLRRPVVFVTTGRAPITQHLVEIGPLARRFRLRIGNLLPDTGYDMLASGRLAGGHQANSAPATFYTMR